MRSKLLLTLPSHVDLPQRLLDVEEVVVEEIVLECGAVPSSRSELELALIDRLRGTQTNGLHEGGIALAKVDLEYKR